MSERREVQQTTYKPPVCLTEARVTRKKLIEEIAGINHQLSNKDKRRKCQACNGDGCADCDNRGGFRLDEHEYHAWRQRALTALRAREHVLRSVNAWIAAEEGRVAVLVGGTPFEPVHLIREAYQLLLILQDDGVEFEDDEWQTVEKLRLFLEPNAKPTEKPTTKVA